MTCLPEYRNDGTVVPKELVKGDSAVTASWVELSSTDLAS
jgi:hypothetical protein